MKLGGNLPVRLEIGTDEKLDSISKKIGTSKSALVRLLVNTFVDQVEDIAVLPPDWIALLAKRDTRSVDLKATRNDKPKKRQGSVHEIREKQAQRAARKQGKTNSDVA